MNPENGLSDRVLLHRPVDRGAGQHLRVQLRRCCDRLRDRTIGLGVQVSLSLSLSVSLSLSLA